MSRTRGSSAGDDAACARAHLGVVAEAGGDQRRGQLAACSDAPIGSPSSVGGAAAPRRAELVAHRVVDDADQRPLGVLDRDADRPLRDAEEEVHRAVERVDDPAQAARARRVAALLPEDPVARAARR